MIYILIFSILRQSPMFHSLKLWNFYQALLCTLEEINIAFFLPPFFFFKVFVLLSQPPVTVHLLVDVDTLMV